MSFVARSVVSGLASRAAFTNGSWTGAWETHGSTQGSISPQLRNGGGPLGTLDAPNLPGCIGSPPWGNHDSHDPFGMPDTGITREYDFTLTYQDIAPDGVTKRGVVVNGQYPGPTIEANWGDWIQVTVHNGLGEDEGEGTAMHWHGFLQKESQWMDGVPGVQQCPIPPGESFTYRFRAEQYGTSWYHSHYSAQYSGGAAGPLIVYGPDSQSYDVDLGPVMVSDWYHSQYYDIVKQTMQADPTGTTPPPPPQSDNNLIQGFGEFDCSLTTKPCIPDAGVAKFKFTSGKKHRLRLINSGSEAMQRFSIDGHTMKIIAHDFVPIEPYEVTALTLGVGQRADVVVEATGKPSDAYWMRSEIGLNKCNVFNANASEALAVILYEDADLLAVPSSSAQPDAELTSCTNDDISVGLPLQHILPDPNPSVTTELHIENKYNGTHWLWHFGGPSYRADFNDALLYQLQQGTPDFGPQSNVHDFGANKSVRFVVYNHVPAQHPMHLHGHNFWVLADGVGTWDGAIANPQNPQRRDVHVLQPAQGSTPSYMVVQIELDNPGLWPFHCHIAWHVSAGLYLNVLERPDDIKALQIPAAVGDQCRAWADYTAKNTVDQIDSGLKKE
ncbi:Multicopper oxidase type 1 [Macrophomina phaseolina MS6]|uniref:Multicopper oxidase type 1 n=1 Tax=Macrophomina phaseolina (strain MS6) TaxID=1126212 RepID=K2RP88_MACPH|nr:Multicopper oxidase type 1 [Macrophomina phaseolina MS6]